MYIYIYVYIYIITYTAGGSVNGGFATSGHVEIRGVGPVESLDRTGL